jgi:hypothetical protein
MNLVLKMKTLEEVIDIEQARKDQSYDIDCKVKDLKFGVDYLEVNNKKYRYTDWAESQFCKALDLPVHYFKRLPPHMKEITAKYDLERKYDACIKLRMDQSNNIRGIVSPKYQIFDNVDFLRIIMDNSEVSPNLKIHRYFQSNDFMSIKMIDDSKEFEDGLKSGICITNSETGRASAKIAPFIYRKSFSNEMVFSTSTRISHKSSEIESTIYEGFKTCIGLNDVIIEKYLSLRAFKKIFPENDIKGFGEMHKLSRKLINRIIESHRVDPLPNYYGVVNAFSHAACELEGMERIALEIVAGDIILLAPNSMRSYSPFTIHE